MGTELVTLAVVALLPALELALLLACRKTAPAGTPENSWARTAASLVPVKLIVTAFELPPFIPSEYQSSTLLVVPVWPEAKL